MQGREGQTAVMGKAGCPRGAWECIDALGSAPRSLRTSPGTEEGSDEHLGLQGPAWSAAGTQVTLLLLGRPVVSDSL